MWLTMSDQNVWRKEWYKLKEIDESPLVVRDFNPPPQVIDRSSRQKICQGSTEPNNTINQQDLIDIYRTLHPIPAECTFFSSSHGTFTKIDHIMDHKTHLGKFKRIKITQRKTLSNHNGIKIEVNYSQIDWKYQDIYRH